MKQGNELVPKKKKSKQVFIYMDRDFPLDPDNIFLSNSYNNVKHFKKENPEFIPLVSYDADLLVAILKANKKKGK